jgi:hypothetical protein
LEIEPIIEKLLTSIDDAKLFRVGAPCEIMYRTFLVKGDSAVKVASSAQKIHSSLAASRAETCCYEVGWGVHLRFSREKMKVPVVLKAETRLRLRPEISGARCMELLDMVNSSREVTGNRSEWG